MNQHVFYLLIKKDKETVLLVIVWHQEFTIASTNASSIIWAKDCEVLELFPYSKQNMSTTDREPHLIEPFMLPVTNILESQSPLGV
jgi:hypothetical protein